jgi:transcription elongation factor Elf1
MRRLAICENCDATFEKDEAHKLYKAYEILERPTKCPYCGAEASIW